MKRVTIPTPPPAPPAPSPAQSLKAEQDLVKQFPARGPKALVNNLPSFERDDARTKQLAPGERAIICEGDSWFNHPLLMDIPEYMAYFGYTVLHSNRPGKHLEESAQSSAPSFVPLNDARKKQIDALLISGGGNDLISWKPDANGVSSIFRKSTSDTPLDYINQPELQRALDKLASYHQQIANQVKQAGASKVKVFVHCYDFIKPKAYPAPLLKGYWVEKQLAKTAGTKDAAFHAAIAKELIARWEAHYKATCADLGWTFVVTQDVVKNRWYDEIHPRSPAFYDISVKFWNALHATGIKPFWEPRLPKKK